MANLTTIERVKAYAHISTAADDVLLVRLIEVASAYIETWCDRKIMAADYVEHRNGTGANRMTTRHCPVIDVTRVVCDGQDIPLSVAGSVGYVFDDLTVRLIGARFAPGVRNVELHYRAGYEQPPADLEQSCIEIVVSRYRDRTRTGIQSQGMAGETVSFIPDELSRFARTVLGQYRRVVAP
jgi:hypothetical protein